MISCVLIQNSKQTGSKPNSVFATCHQIRKFINSHNHTISDWLQNIQSMALFAWILVKSWNKNLNGIRLQCLIHFESTFSLHSMCIRNEPCQWLYYIAKAQRQKKCKRNTCHTFRKPNTYKEWRSVCSMQLSATTEIRIANGIMNEKNILRNDTNWKCETSNRNECLIH